MKFDTITIDFWNTIYDSSNGRERNAYRQRVLVDQMDRFGINILQDQYNEAMDATWKFFEDHWVKNHRTPTSAECVDFIWNYLKLPYEDEPISKVVDAFEDGVLKYSPKLLPGAYESIERLSKDAPLAIISDTGFSPGTILKELMDRDDITKFFSAFSFSNETGYSKPNRKAFEAALNPFKSSPEKSLHIGDIEDTDVVGAKGMGMTAIRYTGSETMFNNRGNDKEKSEADFMLGTWEEILKVIY